jgi:UDP-N-acetylmuramoyl-L-alanyl-D-glutamate--2,6-diaminopimelate ligase
MNKKSEILKLIFESGFHCENMDSFNCIKSLTTNIQYSNQDTGAYYRILNESAENLFQERLSEVTPSLLFLNKKPSSETNYPYVIVPDNEAETFFELILEELFPLEKSKIKVFGITGTNGKSTCVSLCEQISIQGGFRAGSLGTVGVSINGEFVELGISGTTPSSIDLRRVIFEIENEIEFLFMEVSSHAISQKRLGKITLEGAAWTSFSQDHLDFHNTMEEYFIAKLGIINYLKTGKKFVAPSSDKKLITDINNSLIDSESVSQLSIAQDYREKFENYPNFFKVHYNRDNLNLSLELLKDFIKIDDIKLDKIQTPKGRFSIIEYKESFAIVDYAHTPDAILNLVNATKKAFPKARIITLFGCGGDRDRSKRPLMAKAAEDESDFVIITSDNPRSEEPKDIIDDIIPGLENQSYLIEIDRAKAISKGLAKLDKGDVLIIAGKGHEEYQEVKGKKIFFSDFVVVEEEVRNDKSG